MNLPLKLSAEMLAILMIGDGALALTQPRRHMQLWNTGPEPWRNLVSFFEKRPVLTMATGVASIANDPDPPRSNAEARRVTVTIAVSRSSVG